MALSSSTSKEIIKDHNKNLMIRPFVENRNSFAGSRVTSEKDNILFFKKLKLNLEQDKQITIPIISPNKKIPAKKTHRSTARTKF